MNTLNITITLCLLTFSALCYGQQFNVQTDTVEWSANTLKDMQTDTTQTAVSRFTTYGNSKLIWTQTSVDLETVIEFETERTSGDWNNDNQFIVHALRNNKTCTFNFQRTAGVNKVTVTFSRQGGTSRSLEFILTSISRLTDN